MKNVLRCVRCGTVYPLALGQKWGRSRASDGAGADPKCTTLIDAPHAPKARDPDTGQFTITAQERCGGQLSTENVADATPEEEIGEYGAAAERGPLGVPKRPQQPSGA